MVENAAPDAPQDATPAGRMIRRLESIGAVLSDDDKAALTNLPFQIRRYPANKTFVRENDRPGESCVVLSGFVLRYKLVRDGGRQISALAVPGDLPDFQSLHLKVMDHSLSSFTEAEIAFVPHSALLDLFHARPSLGDACWRATLVDAAVFREWLTGIGRRSAKARMAHLLCELFVRLRSVGLGEPDAFDLPLTQAVLADALGLSTVHANRVLQELRGEKLIRSEGYRVKILDWEGLRAVAEFDPAYLHLHDAAF